MRKFNLLNNSIDIIKYGRVVTFVMETDITYFNVGWGNGYVFLSPEHTYHGTHYNDLNDFIEVHGGLTLSEIVDHDMCENWEISTKYIGWWCVGFDTAHFADTITNWPKKRVQEETDYLAIQFLKFTT